MSVTSVNRREFLKVGAAGLAATATTGCVPTDELQIRFRGLVMLETFPWRAVLHVLDGPSIGLPNHRAQLCIRKSAIDHSAPNLTPSRKTGTGTLETWEWDLIGKVVRFNERDPMFDSLTYDTSSPSLPNPGKNGTWKSTHLVPDLKKLTGAKNMTNYAASALQIGLRDGHLESDKPRSASGPEIVWTFKNPANSQTILEQGLSDTLLYRCPLNGKPPIIRIDAGTIKLASGKSKYVSIENMMNPPPVVVPGTPFTLSHFEALYQLVNGSIKPTSTAVPASPGVCPPCDTDPFYCPPAVI